MKTIDLPFRLKNPALACGADMKGAFAFAVAGKAYVKDGFGDLSDPDNLARYEKSVAALAKSLKIKPKAVICDMHPGYFSGGFAARFGAGATRYKVQHHEAHVAAAMVDNGIRGDVIGVAFDGAGFGPDGAIWGGEFFAGSLKAFRRAAHLEYVHMPGGDAAVKEPWRMGASYLLKALGGRFGKHLKDGGRALQLKTMIDKRINSPLTSSAGRLFDAVGNIVLGIQEADFEAHLPMELEKIAPEAYDEHYEFDLRDRSGVYAICVDGAIKGIVADMTIGLDKKILSGRFHNTIAQIIARTAKAIKKRHGPGKVVLSGGVFQNRYLTAKARDLLKRAGFKVYTHLDISTTDSGIPIGQIAIARARGACV